MVCGPDTLDRAPGRASRWSPAHCCPSRCGSPTRCPPACSTTGCSGPARATCSSGCTAQPGHGRLALRRAAADPGRPARGGCRRTGPGGVRLLTDVHPATDHGVPAFLAPVAHGGSVVLLTNAAAESWAARRRDEHATAELRSSSEWSVRARGRAAGRSPSPGPQGAPGPACHDLGRPEADLALIGADGAACPGDRSNPVTGELARQRGIQRTLQLAPHRCRRSRARARDLSSPPRATRSSRAWSCSTAPGG